MITETILMLLLSIVTEPMDDTMADSVLTEVEVLVDETISEEVLPVPENIEYLEYCFNSMQCEVPDAYLPMIIERLTWE